MDGYNIINAWQNLKDMAEENLEFAREALTQTLAECKGVLWEEIVLVFDAYHKKSKGSKLCVDGIWIIYTKEGETADEVIESLVYKLVADEEVEVATSDWQEQRVVMGKGALRLPAKELEERIIQFKAELRRDYLNKNNYKSNKTSLGNFMNEKTFKELERFRKKGK